ncbi:MAG TPA: hypothetical protein VFS92_06410 [Planctomycetota bacterium]|nr:hypothetical protein [Planctomycetota bacterium]
MKIRLGPLPMVLEMNGLMLAGGAISVFGLLFWVAGSAGVVDTTVRIAPEGSRYSHLRLSDAALGISLFGMALYFLGRVVQFVMAMRSRR